MLLTISSVPRRSRANRPVTSAAHSDLYDGAQDSGSLPLRPMMQGMLLGTLKSDQVYQSCQTGMSQIAEIMKTLCILLLEHAGEMSCLALLRRPGNSEGEISLGHH